MACEWVVALMGTPYGFAPVPTVVGFSPVVEGPDLIAIGLGASPGWSEAVAWMKRS